MPPITVVSLKQDITARLAELEPLVAEHQRLVTVLASLGGAQDAPPSTLRGATRSARTGPRRTSKRAPRGANRDKLLAFFNAHPGSAVGDAVAATGIAQNTVYTTISKMVSDGSLGKTKVDGRLRYRTR